MMNDLHELCQFESRLPEEAAYWEELTERIAGSAEPILRELRHANAWWQPFARWSPAVGVAAALAALLVALTGPPGETPQLQAASMAEILTPDDPVSRALVAGADIADLSTMLLVQSGGGR